MDKINRVIKAAEFFYKDLQKDNARYRSWEHCYKRFHDARYVQNNEEDYDNLSLHLAFYLASWGMYRGSSFLLQKDYKVHIPVVKLLLKTQYDRLFSLKCNELEKSEIQNTLEELESSIKAEYAGIRKSVKGNDIQHDVSNTLITKILMGTLGCVPAYDRYFIDGVKELNIATGVYGTSSLLSLVKFYEDNFDRLEKLRDTFKVYDLPYPQMKLLDMGFWQIGFEKHNAKRKAKR